MRNLEKYRGVIPAFYACYDEKGEISKERAKKFTSFLIDKGVKGLYVGGLWENAFTKAKKTEN